MTEADACVSSRLPEVHSCCTVLLTEACGANSLQCAPNFHSVAQILLACGKTQCVLLFQRTCMRDDDFVYVEPSTESAFYLADQAKLPPQGKAAFCLVESVKNRGQWILVPPHAGGIVLYSPLRSRTILNTITRPAQPLAMVLGG